MKLTIPTLAAAATFMAAAPAIAAEQAVMLAVDNMFCDACPTSVKKSLARIPGVTNAVVSYETKRATVTFDDSKTNIETLVKATTNAGYPSRQVQ